MFIKVHLIHQKIQWMKMFFLKNMLVSCDPKLIKMLQFVTWIKIMNLNWSSLAKNYKVIFCSKKWKEHLHSFHHLFSFYFSLSA